MASEQFIRAGKIFVEQNFEKVRDKFREHIEIPTWKWKIIPDFYNIEFEIVQGYRVTFLFPDDGLLEVYIESCGNTDPKHDDDRSFVESFIQNKFKSL